MSLGGQTVYAQIAGYDDGLEAVHHPSSVQGRMFTVREYSGERVALLDETLAGRLLVLDGRTMRVSIFEI